MAATITRGYTFGSTELVTNTKLHTLVDAATISGIDSTNFTSGSSLVVRSTSAPANTDSIWVDTNLTPPIAKVYSGTEWLPIGPYGVFTNKSGAQRTAGEVVVVSATDTGAFDDTILPDVPALGVVMETIADNASGVVALPGAHIYTLITNATVTRGQTLSTSTTAGKGTPSGVNAYAIALAPGTGATTITEALVIGPSIVPANAGLAGDSLVSGGPGALPVFGGYKLMFAQVAVQAGDTVRDSAATEKAFATTMDIPANTFSAAGKTIRVTARGTLVSNGGNTPEKWRFKLDGTEVWATASQTYGNDAGTFEWNAEWVLVCISTGASGTLEIHGNMRWMTDAGIGNGKLLGIGNTSPNTADLTQALTVSITYANTGTSDNHQWTMRQLLVERLN